MPSNVSTVDGMGFEEVNQASYTALISGTNVYAAGSMEAQHISGTNIYAQTLVQSDYIYGDIEVSGLLVTGDTIVNTDGELQSVSIGSAPAFGAMVTAGSGTLSTGSILEVNFGIVFTAAPHLVCSYVEEPSSVGVVVGSNVSTTGFDAIGDTASKVFDWIAVGA